MVRALQIARIKQIKNITHKNKAHNIRTVLAHT